MAEPPEPLTRMSPIRTFILCSGLGRINRGYERFARECFDVLSQDARIEPYLFKGHGPKGPNERTVFCLDRQGAPARCLGKAIGRNGYYIEEMTFLLGLMPYLMKIRPQVIFFSDVNFRTPLWHLRRLTGLSYRLLLSNGGPVGPPFPRTEYVHQLLLEFVDATVRTGFPSERQMLIPYGFPILPELAPLPAEERQAIRRRLGLPLNRKILLSVGALNVSHKRMDYIIREVASLPLAEAPYLVLVGQAEDETSQVVHLAEQLLGRDGFWSGAVPGEEVADYYKAADAFVLASLSEGFGRVYVEALAQGLPCLVHDYPGTRFILGEHGYFLDMRQAGALTKLLRHLPPIDEASRQLRHREAYSRFSWTTLRDQYVEMILRCSDTPLETKN